MRRILLIAGGGRGRGMEIRGKGEEKER